MELTKAIENEPSKNTLEHVHAIITLRTILQERKQMRQKGPTEPEPIEINARQPNITSEGATTYEGANKIRQYSLCSHVRHVAASFIIEEPHHVNTFTGRKKFGNPPLSNKSTFETNNQPQIYVPPNYAYAIVDPGSGKELEYRDLINQSHRK